MNYELYIGNRMEFACNSITAARVLAQGLIEDFNQTVEIVDQYGFTVETVEPVTSSNNKNLQIEINRLFPEKIFGEN